MNTIRPSSSVKRSRTVGARARQQPRRRRWSRDVSRTSDALDLRQGVFSLNDPRQIARSLKRAEHAPESATVSIRHVDAEPVYQQGRSHAAGQQATSPGAREGRPRTFRHPREPIQSLLPLQAARHPARLVRRRLCLMRCAWPNCRSIWRELSLFDFDPRNPNDVRKPRDGSASEVPLKSKRLESSDRRQAQPTQRLDAPPPLICP